MSSIPVHVSHDFVAMSVEKKIELGIKIPLKLTAAATTFTNCTVAPSDLTTLNTALKLAYEAWQNNPSLLAAMQNAEIAWISGFSKDANYVESVASGNGAIIDLSGYNKTKDTRIPVVIPTAPIIKSSKSNSAGGLDMDIASQSGATSYISIAFTSDFTVTYNGNQVTFSKNNSDGTVSQATFMVAKKRKTKMTGLKSKSDMKSQAIAVNAAGASLPSLTSDNGIL